MVNDLTAVQTLKFILSLVNLIKQYFTIISKDRAHRLYKEIYEKCIYWLKKFIEMASKKVIWKLFVTKNVKVSLSPTKLQSEIGGHGRGHRLSVTDIHRVHRSLASLIVLF